MSLRLAFHCRRAVSLSLSVKLSMCFKPVSTPAIIGYKRNAHAECVLHLFRNHSFNCFALIGQYIEVQFVAYRNFVGWGSWFKSIRWLLLYGYMLIFCVKIMKYSGIAKSVNALCITACRLFIICCLSVFLQLQASTISTSTV